MTKPTRRKFLATLVGVPLLGPLLVKTGVAPENIQPVLLPEIPVALKDAWNKTAYITVSVTTPSSTPTSMRLFVRDAVTGLEINDSGWQEVTHDILRPGPQTIRIPVSLPSGSSYQWVSRKI